MRLQTCSFRGALTAMCAIAGWSGACGHPAPVGVSERAIAPDASAVLSSKGCTPATIARADDQRYLFGLVLDQGAVYFTAGGGENPQPTSGPGSDTFGVLRRVVPGTGAIEQLWSGQGMPYRLAINPTYVYFETNDYWSTGRTGLLERLSKDGNHQATLASWQAQGGCLGLAVDSQAAYWTATTGGGGVLSRASSDGLSTTLSQDVMCNGLIALLGDVVYVTAGTKVVAVPKNGGATTVIWDAGVEVRAISPSPEMQAIFIGTTDKVLRFDLVTATVAVVLENRSQIAALATDGSALYVSDQVAGEIVKVPLHGGASRIIAGGQPMPAVLALDDQYVYWVEGQSRAILRCPK
jgi:sugar lactone lactonase YvrE